MQAVAGHQLETRERGAEARPRARQQLHPRVEVGHRERRRAGRHAPSTPRPALTSCTPGRTTLVRDDVYDMNNHGAFSPQPHRRQLLICAEGDYTRREEIFQDHRAPSGRAAAPPGHGPEAARPSCAPITTAFGLAPGEFTDTSHWPAQLYIREARRMVSGYVITQHDATGAARADDPVALASYVMDSHNAKRVLVDGQPPHTRATCRSR